MTRRRAAVVCVSVVAIGAAVWGVHQWAPFDDDPPPPEWSDEIKPLAEFVEDTTGVPFLRDVPVELIGDDDAYAERVGALFGGPTITDRLMSVEDEAYGRALGFWSGQVDLVDTIEAALDPAGVDAWWVPADGTVIVHADGDELSVAAEVDTVRALTHALTDQHLDIGRRFRDADTTQEYASVLAIDNGMAERVVSEYLDGLDADAQIEYSQVAAPAPGWNRLPLAYQWLRNAPSVAGATFAAAIEEWGPTAWDDLAGGRWPTALDQVMSPATRYLDLDATERVGAPIPPKGSLGLRERQLGPVGLYLMLARSSGPTKALDAADGWGNDAITTYRLDDRLCADGHLVADSPADADRLSTALEAWAADRPEQSAALVGRDGVDLYFSVCDPGSDITQHAPDEDSIDFPFFRQRLIDQLVDQGESPAVAECAAVRFFREHTIDEVYDLLVVGDFSGLTDGC